MLIYIKTLENGWMTERTMELPDNEKLLGSILRTVKKHQISPEQVKKTILDLPTENPEPEEAEESSVPTLDPEAATGEPAAPETPIPKKTPVSGTIFERPRYKGFLLIRCRGCGKVLATCTKAPIEEHTCKDCGHVTPLDDMVPAELHCKSCGKRWRYMTNVEDPGVVCQCVGCGAELYGWWDAKKRKYITR